MINRLSSLSKEMLVDKIMANLDWEAWQLEQWASATYGVPITIEECVDLCNQFGVGERNENEIPAVE